MPQSDSDLLKARNAETLFCTWAHKKYPNLKKMAPVTVNFTILMVKQVAPLQTEFPVFWEFLGIPRNSQKFPIMQMTLAN